MWEVIAAVVVVVAVFFAAVSFMNSYLTGGSFSNFERVNPEGYDNVGYVYALVTERKLIFSKRSMVYRHKFEKNWKWCNTGEYTPGFKVEALEELSRIQETKEML